jgi:16S rRNA (uracil1498-N3)-methyltransferase
MAYPRFIGKIEGSYGFLTDEEFHHAKVKRIKKGYKIEINDLHGNVYLSEVEEIGKRELKAKILQKLPVEENPLKITLFQCMPNQLSKIDDLIEPVSELGVYELVPVISKNSAVKEKDVLKKIKKWEKIALNSIKQCERLFPVKVRKPIKFSEINLNSDIGFIFYEREKEQTLKNFIGKKANTVSVIIGAEGGITKDELNFAVKKGFKSVSLGKNILKMETAVISSVCQVNFVFS